MKLMLSIAVLALTAGCRSAPVPVVTPEEPAPFSSPQFAPNYPDPNSPEALEDLISRLGVEADWRRTFREEIRGACDAVVQQFRSQPEELPRELDLHATIEELAMILWRARVHLTDVDGGVPQLNDSVDALRNFVEESLRSLNPNSPTYESEREYLEAVRLDLEQAVDDFHAALRFSEQLRSRFVWLQRDLEGYANRHARSEPDFPWEALWEGNVVAGLSPGSPAAPEEDLPQTLQEALDRLALEGTLTDPN